MFAAASCVHPLSKKSRHCQITNGRKVVCAGGRGGGGARAGVCYSQAGVISPGTSHPNWGVPHPGGRGSRKPKIGMPKKSTAFLKKFRHSVGIKEAKGCPPHLKISLIPARSWGESSALKRSRGPRGGEGRRGRGGRGGVVDRTAEGKARATYSRREVVKWSTSYRYYCGERFLM